MTHGSVRRATNVDAVAVNSRKIHDKLVAWETIESDPDRFKTALSSLATTLTRLRELGYRSRPVPKDSTWQQFRRTGTVRAEQRSEPWSWTTQSGETVQAQAGDWAVRQSDGDDPWSVRDDIFAPAMSTLMATGGAGTALSTPVPHGPARSSTRSRARSRPPRATGWSVANRASSGRCRPTSSPSDMKGRSGVRCGSRDCRFIRGSGESRT